MGELILRFIIGGLTVAAFAATGDVIKSKPVGGVLAAAPSVALPSLILTFISKGTPTVVTESASMVFGGLALSVYMIIVHRCVCGSGGKQCTKLAVLGLLAWIAMGFACWGLRLPQMLLRNV